MTHTQKIAQRPHSYGSSHKKKKIIKMSRVSGGKDSASGNKNIMTFGRKNKSGRIYWSVYSTHIFSLVFFSCSHL